jgi:hypothetical protein
MNPEMPNPDHLLSRAWNSNSLPHIDPGFLASDSGWQSSSKEFETRSRRHFRASERGKNG